MLRASLLASAALLAALAAAPPASAFLLARPTAATATPWDAESNGALAAAGGGAPWAWEPLPDPLAVCLDGSQYGLVTCIGAAPKTFYISIQGG